MLLSSYNTNRLNEYSFYLVFLGCDTLALKLTQYSRKKQSKKGETHHARRRKGNERGLQSVTSLHHIKCSLTAFQPNFREVLFPCFTRKIPQKREFQQIWVRFSGNFGTSGSLSLRLHELRAHDLLLEMHGRDNRNACLPLLHLKLDGRRAGLRGGAGGPLHQLLKIREINLQLVMHGLHELYNHEWRTH